MRGLKRLASDDDCRGYWPHVQVEEFAHINGWEACPDEEPSTEKPSSKTSSRVSTPVTEIVDSKKVEQEPVKKEEKEATPEKKEEEQQKSEPMETDKDEGGTDQLTDRLFSRRGVLTIMAYTGRLHSKGVSFSGFRYSRTPITRTRIT